MAFESNNPGNETETLEVKLDPLQRAGVLLLVLAVIFSFIGYFVSPHDEAGKPILLLPEVKQMEAYRRSSFQWIEDFHALDSQITTIAANQQGDLFAQSREAQSALQLSVRLAQEIDRTAFPPSAVSLHEEVVSTSLGYLEAARKMMIWVGAPEDSKRAPMDENLQLARESLKTLEKSKWLEIP
jgi:hypothetical protein